MKVIQVIGDGTGVGGGGGGRSGHRRAHLYRVGSHRPAKD